MKAILIGAAIAGLVAVPLARAEEQRSADKTAQGSTSQAQSPSAMPSPSASQTLPSQASASKELSGTVKKVDQDKRSLKISSATGGEQELKVAEGAKITCDGTSGSLSQIKEGDQVRASFDASGNQANQIEVTSAHKAKADDKVKSDNKAPEKKY